MIRVGAHTSNVTFLYPLITQWYTNRSTVEQFCFKAFSSQFFIRAALSHSAFEVGQNSTIFTLSTAS